MKQKTAEKRKTYSLDAELSRDLAHSSITMSDELKRSVSRQGILDQLVKLLRDDKTVYKKVLSAIKKS